MVQGHARYDKSRLEKEQIWDTLESISIEAKELGEQVTDGPSNYLASGKRSNHRRFGRLSYELELETI